MAAAVHVASVSSSAEHRPCDAALPELRWNGQAALHTGDKVAHNDLFPVFDEDAAVAAIAQKAAADASKVEALRRNAVGTVQDRDEHDPRVAAVKKTKEGRLPVVCIELAVEPRVGDKP